MSGPVPLWRSTTIAAQTRVNCIAVSADGSTVALGNMFDVVLWDVDRDDAPPPLAAADADAASPPPRLRTCAGHNHDVHAVALTADGAKAASASFDGSTMLWDARRCLCLHTFRPSRAPRSVAFAHSDAVVAVGLLSSVVVLDATTFATRATMLTGFGAYSVQYHRSSASAFWAIGGAACVAVWSDEATPRERFRLTLEATEVARSVAVAPCGSRIVFATDRSLGILDASIVASRGGGHDDGGTAAGCPDAWSLRGLHTQGVEHLSFVHDRTMLFIASHAAGIRTVVVRIASRAADDTTTPELSVLWSRTKARVRHFSAAAPDVGRFVYVQLAAPSVVCAAALPRALGDLLPTAVGGATLPVDILELVGHFGALGEVREDDDHGDD